MKITKWDYAIIGLVSLALILNMLAENWSAACADIGWLLARVQIAALQGKLEESV